ncbi:MAG: hypothetical protein AAGG48_31145 [Planctomycetota bacterium]
MPSHAEIRVADGLQIQLIADQDQVPDCTNVTVDARGTIYASGPGYLRAFVQSDREDSLSLVSELIGRPKRGAHGLFCDGDDLYFVGDGGVWKMTDSDGDGLPDSEPIRVLAIKTGGEHDAHALRKGPDGYFYLIAGNGTKGMFELQNDPQSTIPNPRAGAIWRISPDWSEREVWAHGFRNAFDFDFADDHSIVTFDSDGERDVSLPWYRPTRVYRVKRGDDAGWVSRSWKRPNCDAEMPSVLAEFGRGSPTGVLRSPAQRLPSRLDRGTFVLDWTFGKVLFVGDDRQTEPVAWATGNSGFAVTDIAATPDGKLLVSVGGRGSRGSLYQIDATDPRSKQKQDLKWPAKPKVIAASALKQAIVDLRRQAKRELSLVAAQRAITALQNPESTRRDQLDAATLLIESVGGLGPGDPRDPRGSQQVAAVFDGYRSVVRPNLPKPLIERATIALLKRLKQSSGDLEFANEMIRAIAVLEPESLPAFKAVAASMEHESRPTEQLHRLIALARLPVPRDDEMTHQITTAMVKIPIELEASGAHVDRNWTPRLVELMLALHRRDVLMPGRLVARSDYGHPTHLVWTGAMDPEELERTRIKLLRSPSGPPTHPDLARFIALGNDAVPRPIIRKWLSDSSTRSAGQLALCRYPVSSDANELIRASRSVDPVLRKAAEKALKRIGVEPPPRESANESTLKWLADTDDVLALNGDSERGKVLFRERNCATCHNGSTALGPSLEGVAKRFQPPDLWRATVDPSHTIPDRYRAKIVLTEDGEIIFGLKIYESVDGMTLMNAQGKTVRINAVDIVEKRDAEKSLMPDGLLLGLTKQQAADLMSYVSEL